MTNVLILCHANRWRSALSHVLMERESSFNIKSAGFKEAGKMAGKPVREYAKSIGLDLEDHRSVVVDAEMISWADVVVYMDGGNLKRLVELIETMDTPPPPWSIVCLADYSRGAVTRIPDPAFQRKDSEEFTRTMTIITACVHRLVRSLRRN